MTTKAGAIAAVIATLDEALAGLPEADLAAADGTTDLDVTELFLLRDTVALAHAEATIDVDAALLLQGILARWDRAKLAEKIVVMQTVKVLVTTKVAA